MVSKEEVRYIARLARLQFEAEEEAEMAEQMSRIVAYMEKLNALDTTDVEPMAHVLDIHDVMRDDIVAQRITQEEALQAAPAADDQYFRVPKVID